MKVHHTIESLQSNLQQHKHQGQTIAFVPTMGNLHQGHLDLVKKGQTLADKVVVSIYVNPLQFGANEDLATYPRTLDDDLAKLEALGASDIFVPTDSIMYPEGKEIHTKVSVPKLGDRHCGASRPQFFGGITTVVAKLFNIVQADVSIFGEKDFQQLAIIRKMVDDLCIPTKVVGNPIVREADGLAMSSRNSYLSPEERAIAPVLYQTLARMKEKILADGMDSTLEQKAIADLNSNGFTVDYLTLCNSKTLEPASKHDKALVILAAAMLGKTRLIDNLELSLSPTHQ
ncbi:MAG: pantoate--beta-alanine ligase [Cellvibrionales bacterium]|nr:pantoate--beta-alanine ligase [Cellvibrionales bacterium]